MGIARGAGLRAVVVGSMLCGSAAVAAAFQEGVFVATSESVLDLSPTLETRLELPVERADAIAVGLDGTTWILKGRRLRGYAASGAVLVDVALPTEGDDDEDDDEDDEEDGSSEHVGLAARSGGGAVAAIGRSLFLVTAAGDVEADLALPHHAVAVERFRERVWVAHEKGLLAFEGSAQVAAIALGSKVRVEDLSVAENGELWLALGSEVRVLSSSGVLLRSRKIRAEHVSAAAGGAWVADGNALTRLSGTLQTLANASSFPDPSRIVSLASDPRDGSAYAATRKRVRHIGIAGELLHEEALDDARVKVQHALSLRVDLDAPRIDFLSSGICSGARPILEVSFSDDGAGVDPATLRFSTDEGPFDVSCTFLGNTASCAPLVDLPEGHVTVFVVVSDFASVPNVSAPAATSVLVDTLAPSITLAEPLPPALTNVRELASFGGTVSETAAVSVNGVPIPLSGLTWAFGPVTLAEGANPFEVVARDCAGLETRRAFSVVLDTTAPTAPNPDLVSCSESVGGLSDCRGASAEPGATVTLTNLRTGVSVTAVVDAAGDWFAMLEAEPGDPISVFLTDLAENTGETTGVSVPGAPGEQPVPDPALIASAIDPSLAATPFAQ